MDKLRQVSCALVSTMIGVIVMVGLGEGLARLLGKPQPYTALYEYDNDLGYRFVRNRSVDFFSGSVRAQVKFDGDGVFDRAGKRPESVVILGDGVVAGLELAPSQRLAAQLVAKGKGILAGAVNLSTTGYGPLQEALLLERWLNINNHRVPEYVVLILNQSNDLIDNIPEWEGNSSIPGIERGRRGLWAIVPPKRPSLNHRVASWIAKKSRLYGWFTTGTQSETPTGMQAQQEWLYMARPPKELERGLDALAMAIARIRSMAHEKGFKFVIIDWVDWGLLHYPDNNEHVRLAIERLRSSIDHPLIEVTGLGSAEDWDKKWLIPGTRHANAEATALIANAIVSYIAFDRAPKGSAKSHFRDAQ